VFCCDLKDSRNGAVKAEAGLLRRFCCAVDRLRIMHLFMAPFVRFVSFRFPDRGATSSSCAMGIAPWGFSQLLNFVNLFMRRSLVGLSKRLRRCDTWEYGMILGCVGIMRGEGGGFLMIPFFAWVRGG